MIQCISFDFDDTLAYVSPLTFQLIPDLLKQKGIDIDVDDFVNKSNELRKNLPEELRDPYRLFGTLPKEERLQFIKNYNRARIELLDLPLMEEHFHEIKEWILEQIFILQKKQLFPDVVPTIKRLHKMNLKLFVLSGNHSDGITELLDEAKILHYFKGLITVDKYNPAKIHNFQILLEHTRLPAEEILHVGDDPHTDGYGPTNLKINTVIIRREETSIFKPELDHSYPVIHKLDEIFKFLE